jgi:hypothetical protein
MGEIGGNRDHGGKHGKVSCATNLIKFVVVFQLIGNGDQILRLIFLKELDHGLKDLFVGRTIKICRLQDFKNSTERLILEQDSAEYRLLSLKILGRNPASRWGWRWCGHRKELTHLETDRDGKRM